MKTYTLHVAGLTRELPIIKLSYDLSIASFVILGDTEIVKKTAPMIAKKLPEVDFVVTAEAKGIPLAYEISKVLNLEEPIEVELHSIITTDSQKLYLNSLDVEKIKGKRVALVDDVISTGQSLKALERLVEKAGGKVMAKAAILAEGDAKNRKDIIFLEALPTF